MVPVIENLGKISMAKDYYSISLSTFFLSSSMVLGFFVQLKIRKNCYGFNKSAAIQAVAFDILKSFDRVWYAGVLQKLN